jgi:hypothetical protein
MSWSTHLLEELGPAQTANGSKEGGLLSHGLGPDYSDDLVTLYSAAVRIAHRMHEVQTPEVKVLLVAAGSAY